MSKKDEALKLALSTLANARDWIGNDPEGRWNEDEMYDELCNTVKFVSEALADSALDRMAENARELGLDYEPIVERVENSVGMGHKAWDMVEPKELAKAFHEALAEQPAPPPECQTEAEKIAFAFGWFKALEQKRKDEQPAQQQEPVAWKDMAFARLGFVRDKMNPADVETVQRFLDGDYTSPPASKPWVGLTDDEIDDIYQGAGKHDLIRARAIEAKLKERNT